MTTAWASLTMPPGLQQEATGTAMGTHDQVAAWKGTCTCLPRPAWPGLAKRAEQKQRKIEQAKDV